MEQLKYNKMGNITEKSIKDFSISLDHCIGFKSKINKLKNVFKLYTVKWKRRQQGQMNNRPYIMNESCEPNTFIITMCAFTLEVYLSLNRIFNPFDILAVDNKTNYTHKKLQKYFLQFILPKIFFTI